MRVLCVDDSARSLAPLAALLAAAGHAPLVARGGEEALALLGGTPPDAVILDLVMLNVGGREVLDAIRATPSWAAVPVFLMTAADADLAYRVMADEPPDRVLTKPCSPQDILDALAALEGPRAAP